MADKDQIQLQFAADEPQKEFLSGSEVPPPKAKRGRKPKGSVEEKEPQLPPDDVLFQKQYYGIMDVAAMFGVNASLLRFWEAEFNMQLRKNKKGDRYFTPSDIRLLEVIYDLLRRRKFTIEGARAFLKDEKKAKEQYQLIQSLQALRAFLLELKAHL